MTDKITTGKITTEYDYEDNPPNMIDLFRLDGRVAVVTGAGRGIGRGIAIGMADAGATVIVTARSVDELDSAVAEIGGRGGTAVAHPGDITSNETIDALVARAMNDYGRLDSWISNAGTSDHPGNFGVADFPDEHWDHQIALNLRPHFVASKACAQVMQPGSCLIGISSIASLRPAVNFAAYGAAKAGMNSLTVTMATELGPRGIRANAVSPGNVPTRATTTVGGVAPEDIPAMAKGIPIGRLGKPSDIGAACVWLASDAGSWVTGQNIVVSGGN